MIKSPESLKEKPISSHTVHTNFKHEVAEEPNGENITNCFTCGTCSVTCPVFNVNKEYDPRKIIRMVLLGLKEDVLQNKLIWLCSGCYNCYELCPQNVKITDLMVAIRNIAVREGFIPSALQAGVDQLEKYGRLLEISDFENTVRMKHQIPELKSSVPEIKNVLKKTNIRNAIVGKHHTEHPK